jgi:hypothetical protein
MNRHRQPPQAVIVRPLAMKRRHFDLKMTAIRILDQAEQGLLSPSQAQMIYNMQ